VVGGGIVGCASADYLVRRGVRVLVPDEGRIGHEQSSRNMGAVREVPQGLLGGRDRTVHLVRETAHGVAAVERTRSTFVERRRKGRIVVTNHA
jgi:glycine/D-amino acid oxidase-like deaminating enzyme